MAFTNNVEKCGGARKAANGNMAARCMVDNYGYMQTYASAREPTHSHPHIHPHARTHPQAEICNTFCFACQQLFCERVSVLRYTYIVLLKIMSISQHPYRQQTAALSCGNCPSTHEECP